MASSAMGATFWSRMAEILRGRACAYTSREGHPANREAPRTLLRGPCSGLREIWEAMGATVFQRMANLLLPAGAMGTEPSRVQP